MATCSEPSCYTGLFRESPLQIIVGSSESLYYVHPGALSSCKSSALSARVNGPWNGNGTSRPIDWTDFDEQTVECVLSYLYTGDYCADGPLSGQEKVVKLSGNGDDNEVTVAVQSKQPAEAKSPVPGANDPNLDRPLTPLSRCLQAGLPAETSRTAAGAFKKAAFQNCDDSIGASTLVHAKVYTFAHQFLLFDLEELALQRLTQVLLASDTQTSLLFPHLVDAIHHVYNSTPRANLQDNPARKLLSQYVALRYTTFSDENLDMIISEGGEFMIDLSHKLARRLSMSGSSSQSLEKQIDELQLNVNRLEIECQSKEIQLERAKQEIAEWESWNRGISGKNKKARRKVAQSLFTVDEPLHT